MVKWKYSSSNNYVNEKRPTTIDADCKEQSRKHSIYRALDHIFLMSS